MEAIIISQEGRELPLLKSRLYKIGSARNDDIFVLHDQVSANHSQLIYDNKANTWNIEFMGLPSQDKQSPERKENLDPEVIRRDYNVDILPRKEVNRDVLNPNDDIRQILPKAVANRRAFVKRANKWVALESKTPYTLQNNDTIILGNAEDGYKILFKESENPFPKQIHPPEPYGEAVRLKSTREEEIKEMLIPH